jgi:glycosyltransferase involved in cell wall biosynthesis
VRPVNVLHLRDTYEIGGPGKTILETQRAIDGARFHLQLAVFATRHEQGETPFMRAAREYGLTNHVVRGYNQYDPRLVTGVVDLVKRLEVDVLHAHEFKSDVIAWAAARLHRVPIVTTLHGWIGNGAKQRLFIGLDRQVARGFDRVIAVSREIERQSLDAGVRPARLRMLHNAIVTSRYRRTNGPSTLRELTGRDLPRPIALTVGRLSPEKGHADFIDALAEVKAAGGLMTTVLAGDGPSRPALEAQVRARGLQDAVHFLGYIDRPQRVLEEADLMVLPSHTEGLPNVALESLMLEVPVLATRVGGTPEVIVDGVTGRLVPAHAPPAMAAALLEFLEDSAAWRAMATRGRDFVEREFDFTTRTRRLERIYLELLGRAEAIEERAS